MSNRHRRQIYQGKDSSPFQVSKRLTILGNGSAGIKREESNLIPNRNKKPVQKGGFEI